MLWHVALSIDIPTVLDMVLELCNTGTHHLVPPVISLNMLCHYYNLQRVHAWVRQKQVYCIVSLAEWIVRIEIENICFSTRIDPP